MLQSLILYVGIGALAVLSAATVRLNGRVSREDTWASGLNPLYWLGCSAVVAFVGFRDGVGTDYPTYVSYYYRIAEGKWISHVEPGFNALNVVVGWVEGGATWVFVVSAALAFVPVFWAVGYRSICPPLSMAALIGTGFLFLSMNAVRQAIAVGVFAASIPFIWRAQPLRFASAILFGALFHYSILFWLPTYWVARAPISRVVWLAALSIAIVFAVSYEARELLRYPVQLLSTGAYDHLVDRSFASAPRIDSGAGVLMQAIVVGLILALRGKLSSSSNSVIRVSTNLALLGSVGSIATSSFWAVPRLFLYGNVAWVFLFPILVAAFRGKSERTLIAWVGICYWAALYVRKVWDTDAVIPYQTVFG